MVIGDGVNNIPVALTQTDMGVSVGSGTDVVISAADVIMSNPTNVHKSIESIFWVSESMFRRIARNFAWPFMYNLSAIILAGSTKRCNKGLPQWKHLLGICVFLGADLRELPGAERFFFGGGRLDVDAMWEYSQTQICHLEVQGVRGSAARDTQLSLRWYQQRWNIWQRTWRWRKLWRRSK